MSAEAVRVLAQKLALEATLAGTGSILVSEFVEDGSWRCEVARVEQLLNAHFGRETRHQTFPTIPAEPVVNIARAVAALLKARLVWTPGPRREDK